MWIVEDSVGNDCQIRWLSGPDLFYHTVLGRRILLIISNGFATLNQHTEDKHSFTLSSELWVARM
jgi:hypothetical protein